jgi:hypothetical protein
MLHNFGIFQNSLSDIVFGVLKEPSIQAKLLDVLKAVNPSIASLLSYDER